MEKFCTDCGRKVSNNNTTGRCKSCGVKHSWTRPECRESHKDGNERFLEVYYSSTELQEAQSAKCKANWTEDLKAVASEQAKRRWDDPKYRAKHINNLCRGIVSDVQRERLSKNLWHNPEQCKHKSEYMKALRSNPEYEIPLRTKISAGGKRRWAERKNVENIVRALRENRKKAPIPSSRLEFKVADALEELGLDYIHQFKPNDYNRVYDFLLLDFNLLIEVDGDYWHSFDRAKAIDGEKTNWAFANNYSLIRLKEHDIKEFGIAALIQTELADHVPDMIIG